ncbi:MAG: hypothetical protein E7556_07430 [Ruminococcaceae bacterium]|nr:hypothetical protein [Oscillospiraceae bacterium]
MTNTLEDVLNETITWEKSPINEIFNTSYTSTSNYSKQIILYGPTQVGKTTLIMDLIGIKNSRRLELDELLKGGSRSGSASTSSAIIYSRWNEDMFGISQKNIHSSNDSIPEKLTADEFKQRIQSINSRNRSQDVSLSELADIYCFYIPKDYFEQTTELQNIQMIDLPGFGERNEKMQKRADEIISYISGFVAGAVVVVKSDNIQSLQSDYKRFISNHHINHLAVAISYSASRNLDVRKMLDGTTTDKEVALNIANYYYNLIEEDNYMHFNNLPPETILFPLEKREYLEENLPEFIGAFDQLRQMLKVRITSMTERTAIKSCIEQLDLEIKNCKESIECIKTDIEKLANRKEECDELIKKAKKIENKLINELKILDKKITFIITAKNEISKKIDTFEENKHYTEFGANCFWSDVKSCTESKKKDELFKRLSREIDDCIGEKAPLHDKKLYLYIKNEMEKVLDDFSFNYFFKGVWGHGKKWEEKAARLINSYYKNICTAGRDALKKESEKLIKKAKNEKTPLENQKNQNFIVLNNLQKELDEITNKQSEYTAKIKQLDEEADKKIDRQKHVIDIFIKHFYKKVNELEYRIEKEPVPEIKTALFIVLSSIYLSMKPYLEDIENE